MSIVPPTAATPPAGPPLAPLEPALTRARQVARRLLGCDHLAADAVQEALGAWCRLAAPPPEPTAWLVRAVVLRARHLRRTLQRRQRHELHAATHHCALHRGCDNPLHHAYAHELGEHLSAALAALPAQQRRAFELFVQHGLDYAGIAGQLGWPIGTVRSRLHRARTALQAALGAHREVPPAAAGAAARGARAAAVPIAGP